MTFRFGVASEVNADSATVAFICTVAFLVILEKTTHFAEKVLGSSATYNKMLQRIYMELMSTGFVSFSLAMYQATHPSSSDKDWIQVSDFIGFLLFFVAIFFVAHAIYIIIISLVSAKKYEKYHQTSIAKVVTAIGEMKDDWSDRLYRLRFIPCSPLRTIAEFKIIHAIFRDTYWLPLNFEYGLYLSGCFERYSLKIISISDSSWALAVGLCLLNYIRLKFGPGWMWNCDGFKSGEDESSEAGRYGISNRCSMLHLQLFFCCGCALCVYILGVYVVSRLYIIRLMSRAGISKVDEYIDFLRLDQSTTSTDVARQVEIEIGRKGNDHLRMSIATLRSNIDAIVQDKEKRGKTTSRDMLPRISRPRWSRLSSVLVKLNIFSKEDGSKVIPDDEAMLETPVKRRRAVLRTEEDKFGVITRRASIRLDLQGGPRGTSSAMEAQAEEGKGRTKRSNSAVDKFLNLKKQKSATKPKRETWIMGALQNIMSGGIRPLHGGDLNMKLSEDFSSIYFFSNPKLYFLSVEFGVMLNSLYLSLWVTNFIAVVHTETNLRVMWQILMMCPLFVIIPVIGEVVKAASLLSAVADLNVDVMGIVLEEMEEQTHLLDQLRAFIGNRFATNDEELAREIVEALFQSIDLDDSGELDKMEVRQFLRALHLHYSDEKFERLFKAMGGKQGTEITCEELFLALCPQFEKTKSRPPHKSVPMHFGSRAGLRQPEAASSNETTTPLLCIPESKDNDIVQPRIVDMTKPVS